MPRIIRPRLGGIRPFAPHLREVPRQRVKEEQLIISVLGASGLSANPTLAGPVPRMPKIGPLAPTRLEDMLRYPQPRLLAPMDMAIAVRPFYARTQYTFSAPAAVAVEPGLVAKPFDLGFKVGGLATDAMGPFGLSIYGNPSLMSFSVAHLQTAHWGQLIGAGFSDGYAALSAGGFIAAGSGWAIPTVQVVAWDDSLGLYGNFAYINPATSVVAFAGINAAKAAKRRINNMGAFTGPERARIAVAHGLPADSPLQRVQIRRRHGWSAALRAGGGIIWISGQLRVGESHTYDDVYRTFLPPKQARELVFSDHGFMGHVRNLATALNWRKEPLPLPDMKDPYSLKLGDELIRDTSYSTIFSGMVGNLAGWGGAQVFLKGDIQFNLRRLDTHIVELTVTPLTIRSVGVFGYCTLGVNIAGELGRARTWRQSFLFDLRYPTARAAYDNAVAGRLPGHLKVARASRRALFKAGHPEWITELPEGVHASYLQKMKAHQTRFGGGFNAYVVPRGWLPAGWEPSFLRHHINVQEHQSAHAPNMDICQDTTCSEKRRALAWLGLVSRRMIATTHYNEVPDGPPVFQNLTAGASWLETHASSKELTRRICHPLQNLFNMRVNDLPKIRPRQPRQVTLVREFSENELTELSFAARESRRAINVVAATYGVNKRRLRHLLSDMYWSPTVEGRSCLVHDFLLSQGIPGFAAIAALVPKPAEAYVLQSITTAYDEASKRADTLLLKYPESLGRIHRRGRKDLAKGIKKLAAAQEVLRADVFYPPGELKAIGKNLQTMRDRLTDRAAFFQRQRHHGAA